MPTRSRRVVLPTFHEGQIAAFNLPGRFKVVRCGRRWGKTDLAKAIVADGAARGWPCGWFSPDHKRWSEAYVETLTSLHEVKSGASKVDGVIRTFNGGRIDYWTLDDESAGRSRMYKRVVIDEAAFTKPNMMDIWKKSIQPTLLDLGGTVTVLSNTNGIAADNFLYQICNDKSNGFVEYHAPTFQNPYLPRQEPGESTESHAKRRQAEFERLKAENHPLVFQQEYLAEFVDWSGVQFFNREDLLENGAPVAVPTRADAVFATIDTATKTGKEHDATGCCYWAYIHFPEPHLVLLDYELFQIEGSLLEAWLPTVFQQLEGWAKATNARNGSVGAHIEDKSSGMVLLQQATKRGWPAHAIDSQLTSVGKDERAISVSGYVYRKMVKIAQPAFNKVVTYKGFTRNQLLTQVLGYRIGVKDQQDDLLDCFCYGVAISLGDTKGF